MLAVFLVSKIPIDAYTAQIIGKLCRLLFIMAFDTISLFLFIHHLKSSILYFFGAISLA